jgi:hypothetical protein
VADIASALAHPDHRARLMALKAVLDANDAAAVETIASLLPREDNPKVKNAMAIVLGRLGNKSHGPVLARLLRDPDATVRMRAAEGIVAVKDSGSYPALVGALVSETDARVRDFCAHSLMKLGGEKLMRLFQVMLQSDVAWMKESAVMALGMFNSPKVVPVLKLVYLKEAGPLQELTLRALERLAEMGNDAAREVAKELTALREPPRLDVDFANLGEDTGSDELGFEDTYTGGKLPRIEMGSPLEEEPEDAPPIAMPPSPAAEREDTPATVPVPALGISGSKLPREAMAAAVANAVDPMPDPVPEKSSTRMRKQPEPEPAAPVAPPSVAGGAGSGSARRPGAADRSGQLSRSGDNFEGGMVAAPPSRAAGPADDLQECPACGKEIAANARRCKHCDEVFDAPEPVEEQVSAPMALTAVAVLTVIVSALEAAQSFAVDARTEGGVAMARGAIRIVELFAAVGAARGQAWGWWIWLPLAFVYFIAAVSNGEAFPAARTCICLLVLTHATVRDYCSR